MWPIVLMSMQNGRVGEEYNFSNKSWELLSTKTKVLKVDLKWVVVF